MENIIEPNKDFDFSELSLANPTGIQGGAYFTKIQYNNKPLYIQTPKSLTKQGFVKNGKKIYCDLMFDNNDEKIIHWIENLETKCQELIYEKGESWFQNKLDMPDIEGAFASPLRVYKSGKFYLLRVNIKLNYITNVPNLKIYNESEIPLTIDDVNSNTNIISILEIQGIKFTSRNFQIEIEMKQTMVFNTEILFDNCLIKTNQLNKKLKEPIFIKEEEKDFNLLKEENLIEKKENNLILEDLSKAILEETEENKETEENTTDSNILNDSSIELNVEELEEDKLKDDWNDLTEFQLNTNIDTLETMTLKKPNQVYYEIYKEARNKAKLAKKEAIQAFLEAKNIKKTYMLNDLDESDESDMDNISECSDIL